MKLKDLLVGIRVALEVEGGDAHGGCAEHDEIYILHGKGPSDLTEEQRKALEDAGWSWREESFWMAFV